MENILFRIADIVKAGKKAALCIIVETTGSSPRKAGSKMIVYEDKSIEGTIGGGHLEYQVIDDAIKSLTDNQPQKLVYTLNEDQSMHCGGTAEVYIEPVIPNMKLYIFGAGHIGKVLAGFTPGFGFHTILIDYRKEILDLIDIPGVEIVLDDFIGAAQKLKIGENDFIVIVTPKHAFDENLLAIFGKKKFAYLGMIGSKTKVALARKRMLKDNILTTEELDKVDMPIGIKFNAQTPEEIAISILAKLIDIKNSLR